MDVVVDVDERFRESDPAGVGGELGRELDREGELHPAADHGEGKDMGDEETVAIESVRGGQIAGAGAGMGGKIYAANGPIMRNATGDGGGVYRPAEN